MMKIEGIKIQAVMSLELSIHHCGGFPPRSVKSSCEINKCKRRTLLAAKIDHRLLMTSADTRASESARVGAVAYNLVDKIFARGGKEKPRRSLL